MGNNVVILDHKWDQIVLDAVRRGVATRTAIARETQVGPAMLRITIGRLLDAGKIEVVTKGWYAACES